MKTIYTLVLALFLTTTLWAQAPQKMTYQAVVRDGSDVLITNTTVGTQISILEGSPTGTAVFVETHTPSTNSNGLMTLQVGAGTVVSGDFSTIDWGSDSFFIKSEIDPSGGTSYSIEGTSELLSVPYALYAENAGAGGGNSLDEAYDEQLGGAPETRIINADDGKIEIISTDNRGLEITGDADYTGLYVSGATALDQTAIYGLGNGDAFGIWASNLGNKAAFYGYHNGVGEGLHILHDGGVGKGIFVDNNGTGIGTDIWNRNAANASNALKIDNDGSGDAMYIDNLAGNAGSKALKIDHSGAGDGLEINLNAAASGNALDIVNAGTRIGLNIWNSNAANGFDAMKVDNDGTGIALLVDNLAGGGEVALAVDQFGTGDAIDVRNTGTGIGIDVRNTNAVNDKEVIRVRQFGTEDAMLIDNAGPAIGLNIFNGNPASGGEALFVTQAGAGTGIFVDNGGTGKGAHIFTGSPTNGDVTLFANTMGLGSVATFNTDDNNANTETTLVANNFGAGETAQFITTDEMFGKVNDSPTVNVVSNGKGIGVNINVINAEAGSDANTEPALFAKHDGEGRAGYFETPNLSNDSPTVEIINHGIGNGLHIDMFGNPGSTPDDALHVEQSNTSGFSTFGRVAHFDLLSSGSVADAAVLISSSATSGTHSALRVIPADPSKLAAVFEGDVEVASDILIGGTMSAAAKAFKIDHPLDPDNKYLVHNSIESNERVNIYSGNVSTNKEGFATIELPNYMSALNTDFKYQLTIVDKSFAQAVVWEPLNANSNTFVIKTNEPNIKVSWQLTGTRQDTWALENPMQVEVEKNNGL
ncbi:MAG: hypothetical protein HKN48_12080 [Flavobacteriaceae bacterium]|nr:hypothetical protein [Flavobacteriaceae bacterium]